MALNTDNILYALRARLFANKIVTGKNDFIGANLPMQNFSVKSTPFWIAEKRIGDGDRRIWTTRRKRQMLLLVQYDLYVPAGSGTKLLGQKMNAIDSAFDIMDDSKCVVSADGVTGRVYRIKVDEDVVSENVWCIRPVLLYVRCSSHG